MHSPRLILLLFLIFSTAWISAEDQPAVVCSIKPGDLAEYENESPAVKNLIETSLALTCKNLGYIYGSDAPARGGMDCSGAVSYVLKSAKIPEVPRSSYTIYQWANRNDGLTKLEDVHSTGHSAFRLMKPGDLVFWEGTYAVKDRNPPISHVMLYLGTLKKDGQGVLFGASSGRRFRGTRIHGVSVFDFKVPSATSKSKMVAFGPVPGLRDPEKTGQPIPSTEQKKKTVPSGESGSEPASKRRPTSLAEKLRQLNGGKEPFKNIFSNKR